MSRPVPGAGGTSDLADWLPLLGSIVHALRSMGDHGETSPESPPGPEAHPNPSEAEESKG